MSEKFDRFTRNLPKVFNASLNPMLSALLQAFSQSDTEIVQQLQNTKAQLFVKTAEGKFLDRLSSGYGMSRPPSLGLSDSDFKNLIPPLSLEAKQIRVGFYKILDVFWGPLFSRANITSVNYAPFDVSTGETLEISIDGKSTQIVKILAGDIAINGAATAEELATLFARFENCTPSVVTDQLTGRKYVNLRTDSPGARGSVEIKGGTMLGGGKLNLEIRKVKITDLTQRTVLYQLRPRELIIEIPATVPALRRTLKGSHHFHADATIEPEIGGHKWQGSFMYKPTGSIPEVTSQVCTLQQTILPGDVFPTLIVSGATTVEDSTGYLIFDWGNSKEERPVKYFGRPNSSTLRLDPGHVFSKGHSIGAKIHVLSKTLQPAAPRKKGEDLAIYLTSPSDSRGIVQGILTTLAAAGIIVTFVITLPSYKYLCRNPYA